jgi:asparagine synthase (glutamine-hydrolysing)
VCGIAGILRRRPVGVSPEVLLRMAGTMRHRGPDGYGLYAGARAGLAHTRLSIIDLAGGAQPIANEDGRYLIVYNGEVYNYIELREELEARGHAFRTRSDTEVLVHGYEEWGDDLPARLNGQFAFAILDRRAHRLFLARDRFGVRPLFYAERQGDFLFASEVKALFASGEVTPEPDPAGLDQVFTFWAAKPPRTVFLNVVSLEPGCLAHVRDGRCTVRRYWSPAFPEEREEAPDAVGRLDGLMESSVRFRLRADVPVGGYLSGGLDSTITCALAAEASPFDLRTFSVAFDDPVFDESAHQRLVAQSLGSRHAVQQIGAHEIAAAFPDVVAHTETPLVRTAPAPLYLLSRVTRDHGIKVVLTGEGADELFLGYDLFKETAVRLFCLRQPASRWRPLLFDRLYHHLPGKGRGGEFWRRFFLTAGSPEDPLFSHLPRFLLTARIKELYASGMREMLEGVDVMDELRASLPAEFSGWSPLNRAAYLELVTLLSPYLLSSQGDRMGLAHSVEGRFPYLDHRLFEFTAALPTRSKLRGLKEKEILRRWAAGRMRLPTVDRAKQPYRAPDVPAFFGPAEPAYVADALAPEALARAGVFDPRAVAGLARRCRAGLATGFRESQAMIAVLSTQLWHGAFMERPASGAALRLDGADVVLRDDADVLETSGVRDAVSAD